MLKIYTTDGKIMKGRIIITILSLMFVLSDCDENSSQLWKEKSESFFSKFEKIKNVGAEYTDSTTIDSFLINHDKSVGINGEKIASFYRKRNYRLAWSNKGQFIPQATILAEMLEDVTSHGLKPIAEPYLKEELLSLNQAEIPTNEDIANRREEIDLMLTSLYYKYVSEIWKSKMNSKSLGWFIDKKKFHETNALELVLASTEITTGEDSVGQDSSTTTEFSDIDPLNPQYNSLKNEMDKYIAIQKTGGWPMITTNATLHYGNRNSEVFKLKKRLAITNDFTGDRFDENFDKSLVEALKKFQARHGLKASGVLTPKTRKALNVPIEERINQLKVNMERWRWMPKTLANDYVWINIPEFKLHLIENGNEIWDMNVIVGRNKADMYTPIFNDEIEQVVFNPTWSVPDNIVKTEIWPILKRNNTYLNDNLIDVFQNNDTIDPLSVDWITMNDIDITTYKFRQRHTASNPLGKIKFVFPNEYDIYLHDTNTKYLFGQNSRSYSHGCVRLEDPQKLAEYLLRNDSAYSQSRIQQILSSDQEELVKLSNKEPIYIVYFTTWTDKNGELNFREDLYNYDSKMRGEMQSI